ncbi:hypothetical protein [Bosea sp. (in: a-proteobacteria)]|uniref:COG3904 family protein n=1 Tax=Bosea sp. (in: a-proteobacteria) TaxID=1871050 RepID=UPI002FCCA384
MEFPGLVMRIASFLAFALSLLAGPAAAQDKPAPAPEPMRIVAVRSAEPGCEPHCREWLAAQGAITNETLEELRRAIAGLNGRKLPVLIYSTGGTVEVAITMGEIIRQHGLDIAVARTVLTQRDPNLGTIDERSPLCSSACTFVLAGGVRRIIPPQSRIGVHQQTILETETTTVRDYQIVRRREGDRMVERRELVNERKETRTVKQEQATGEIDARIARHLDAMGLDRSFLKLTVSTPADTMRYLRPEEMRSTTIATQLAPATAVFSEQRSDAAPADRRVASAILGNIGFGQHRGRDIRLELAVREGSQPGEVGLRLRLLSGNAPIATRLRTVTIGLPGSAPIVASNDDSSMPEGPMTTEISRERLCSLGDLEQIVVRIDPREDDASAKSWIQTGSASELLLAPALRAAIC